MRIFSACFLLYLGMQSVLAETSVERGRYIVEVIGACGNCHTPMGPDGKDPSRHLAGGMHITDGGVDAWPSNITPDLDTGIGTWTDEQVIRAFREGIRPDGSVIGPLMPIELYRHISDEDAQAIVAYLRTVQPVRNEVKKSSYPFPLPASYGPPLGTVSQPDRKNAIEYGEYLAGPLGHCMECHSGPGVTGAPDLENALGTGGMVFEGPWGHSVSPNITPVGLAGVSDAEIKQIITTGTRADGSKLLPPMGFTYYARLTDEDLDAIVAYLRSLPPR